MGVPRFKKLPQDVSSINNNVLKVQAVYPHYPASNQYHKMNEYTASSNINPVYTPNIPNFQALPLSTSEKFESLTKVEKSDEDLPHVDLKGHTIEELAVVANVSVDTIKSAIKLRQQQMLVEKKIHKTFDNHPKFAASLSTVQSTIPSTIAEKTTMTESTTQSTTTLKVKTTPSFVPKKKVKKHPLSGSHKVF